MDNEDSKLMSIVGTILGLSMAGAIICGILECFGVNTGAVGGIFALIMAISLPLLLLYSIFRGK